MKIDYYLQGFGFENLQDYTRSTFGFLTTNVLSISAFLGLLKIFIVESLGFDFVVFVAFVALNIAEFITGIEVSKKKKIPIKSRPMGRMFLKVGTYLGIIWVLNQFMQGLDFPSIYDYELDPFTVFYWAFVVAIIYQLLKSLAENLRDLEFEEMNGFLGVLTRLSNKYLLKDESSKNTE